MSYKMLLTGAFSTPAEGVPALRAYGMWGEFGGRESDRHAKMRIPSIGTLAVCDKPSPHDTAKSPCTMPSHWVNLEVTDSTCR
jgi:hypothetical protein